MLWHAFVMPETACRADTPDSRGASVRPAGRNRHSTTPAMTLQQILLMVDSMDVRRHEPGSDMTNRRARRVVALLLTFSNLTTTARRADRGHVPLLLCQA